MTLPRELVTVCYEDQRGENRQFRLHDLLLTYICEREVQLKLQRWQLEGYVGKRPMKGVTGLLKAACDEVELVAPDCHPVVAVFDSDRIRGALGLPGDASRAAVEAAIIQRCVTQGKLRVVLLERNMETVLRAVQACLPAPTHVAAAGSGAQTRVKPSRLTRDLLLARMAKSGEEGMRQARKALLERVPSLGLLVETVEGLLAEQLGVAPARDT